MDGLIIDGLIMMLIDDDNHKNNNNGNNMLSALCKVFFQIHWQAYTLHIEWCVT